MRKLIFFICFVTLIPNCGFGGAEHFNLIKVGDCGSSNPIANEYHRISYSKCLECDDDLGDISNGAVLFYSDNGNIKSKTCDLGWGDLWNNFQDIQKCSDNKCNNEKTYKITDRYNLCTQNDDVKVKTITESDINVVLTDDACNSCCVIESDLYLRKEKCSKAEFARWDDTAQQCACTTPDGAISYGWNEEKGQCEEKITESTIKTNCPSNSRPELTSQADCKSNETFSCKKQEQGKCICGLCSPKSHKTCREQRSTVNGKACCDTLKMGTYDKQSDSCICKGGLEFKIENGTGYCRPKAQQSENPGVQYECDSVFLTQIAKWKASCVDNADILALIGQIEEYCASKDKTETGFMAFYNTLLDYNPATCGKTPDNPDPVNTDDEMQKLSAKITKSAGVLGSMSEGFKVSVWKNKEGNFNTARLASDSIAGVVLGTAGGLITSNVVKKNQVKSGFEDIQCTIGGQVVADWGDEFRVGIQ